MKEEIEDEDFDISDRNDFEDEEIPNIMENHELDYEEAEEVSELMNSEGLDEDEAVEVAELDRNSGGCLGGIISFLIILGLVGWWFGWFGGDSSYEYEERFSDYKTDCSYLEPENPYDYDSGHYAGFEWGENGNSCGGNSNSFIEGCEDYQAQEEAYDECLSN